MLSDMHLYGFDDAFIKNFEASVDELTIETASRLVKYYFLQDKLQMVSIGNASEIEDIAAGYGEPEKVNITAVGSKSGLDSVHNRRHQFVMLDYLPQGTLK